MVPPTTPSLVPGGQRNSWGLEGHHARSLRVAGRFEALAQTHLSHHERRALQDVSRNDARLASCLSRRGPGIPRRTLVSDIPFVFPSTLVTPPVRSHLDHAWLFRRGAHRAAHLTTPLPLPRRSTLLRPTRVAGVRRSRRPGAARRRNRPRNAPHPCLEVRDGPQRCSFLRQ